MFLTDVKILLHMETSDCTNDELLVFIMRQVKNKILNYCNIQEIPPSHQYLIADMTAAYYKLNYSTSMNINSNTDSNTESNTTPNRPSGAIKKETIGDYSVEYDTGSSASSSGAYGALDSSLIESVLMDYKSELNQIRKLRL